MTVHTAGDVAAALLDLVDDQLAALADGPLPDLRLPGVLMGHEVGPDVRADLLFTLGLLHDCGRTHVGGRIEVVDAIARLLDGVQGRRTNTFYSYRVAETVGRFGPLVGNPLLASLTDAQREEVATATDSTDWLELLDAGILPRNYAAVLSRCEHARRELGLPVDTGRLDELLGRVRVLLGGHLDDSNPGIGRYDIYTVDIHLFCEPLAALVGDPWVQGTRLTLDLVDRVATRDGSAVPWGRSTGILALCHTVELAGLVARQPSLLDGSVPSRDRWFARAAHAARRLDGWFDAGWVDAHRYRSSDPYRGLDRRLQMTLDCLGKLVDSARGLLLVADEPIEVDESALFPERDEVVWFDRDRHAGVWTFRGAGVAFSLPLVGGTTSDYLPAPRNPGLFEAPVGSALATGSPLILHGDQRYAGAGLPVSVEHRPGELRARYEGFPAAGHLEPEPSEQDHGRSSAVFAGTRDVTWRVDGRALHVDEQLHFDRAPHAVALQVTEAEDRPLHVRFDADSPHSTAEVDVAGIAEYRSCWGELPRLHQIDLEPSTDLRFAWSVTPALRVVSSAVGAAYNDRLYAPLVDRVRVEPLPHGVAAGAVSDPGAVARLAARTDQFHLHWPEWLLIGDVTVHQALAEGLRSGGTRIVWTQHNLIGHDKNPEAVAFYEVWARAADLVIHHSEWGKAKALDRYGYGDRTRHVVIPHAHFGGQVDPAVRGDRAAVEAELGLRHGALRLGVVGAPRVEKDVELVMRAVARAAREDIELLVLSLRGDEQVLDDPRIVALVYEEVDRTVYDRRFAAIDALVMPFDPDGEMLTTGTVGDAVGHGIPTIASAWPFVTEALGEAAITYGSTEDDLVACLEALDQFTLERAAEASRGLRDDLSWAAIAERTYAELDRLGSSHH